MTNPKNSPYLTTYEVDQDWLIQRAVKTLEISQENRTHFASIAALKEIGILTGLRVEKESAEITGKGGMPLAATITIVKRPPLGEVS